jgi:biotin transport system ATP-binding protein
MGSAPYVILENVSLSRGGQSVFHDLSLSAGERRLGLIGPNGAGKSSLLRLIHGLTQPDHGSVRTLGLDVVKERKQIPSRVGFLFQNPDRQIIFPTVGEEIAFTFEGKGLPKREAMGEASAWLARFGREHWYKRAVHELSEGQKHLVCLIAVLALEPSLILLDEPFASLDLKTRLHFARRLEALPQAIIMASHDMEFLETFERILWIEDGRIRADGRPAEILAAYKEDAHRQVERFP